MPWAAGGAVLGSAISAGASIFGARSAARSQARALQQQKELAGRPGALGRPGGYVFGNGRGTKTNPNNAYAEPRGEANLDQHFRRRSGGRYDRGTLEAQRAIGYRNTPEMNAALEELGFGDFWRQSDVRTAKNYFGNIYPLQDAAERRSGLANAKAFGNEGRAQANLDFANYSQNIQPGQQAQAASETYATAQASIRAGQENTNLTDRELAGLPTGRSSGGSATFGNGPAHAEASRARAADFQAQSSERLRFAELHQRERMQMRQLASDQAIAQAQIGGRHLGDAGAALGGGFAELGQQLQQRELQAREHGQQRDLQDIGHLNARELQQDDQDFRRGLDLVRRVHETQMQESGFSHDAERQRRQHAHEVRNDDLARALMSADLHLKDPEWITKVRLWAAGPDNVLANWTAGVISRVYGVNVMEGTFSDGSDVTPEVANEVQAYLLGASSPVSRTFEGLGYAYRRVAEESREATEEWRRRQAEKARQE